MSVESAAPERPYKGLRPFEDTAVDALLFFGRERERELIAANLMAARLTVLYGATGVGKSSVLNAGVVHDLRELARERREFAVAVYSAWSDEQPIEGIAASVQDALAGVLGFVPDDPGGSLVERLAAWSELLAGELYLVLDQVEEYFLYHGVGGGQLLDELPPLVTEPGVRVNVLLGIREDALARLDVFKAKIPALFGNYLRLERLDRQAARAAIVGPLEQWSLLAGSEAVTIEPELVDAILDAVRVGRIEANGAGPAEDGEAVEPPYLQIVLDRLWDAERDAGSRVLRRSTLDELGGARRIVAEHLDRALDALEPAERDTAAAMFAHLVTPSGAKVAHEIGDLAGYAGVDDPEARRVAGALVEERILRPVEGTRGNGARVEIFHDVLASAVADWRRRHEAGRQVERERRRQRRFAALAAASLIALVGVTAVAVYAVVQQREADDQRREARARELAAQALVGLPIDPGGSLRLALDAATRDDSDAVEEVLRTVLVAQRQDAILGDGRAPITQALEMSGYRSFFVLGDAQGRVLAPAARIANLVVAARHRGRITKLLELPTTGGHIFVGSDDGTARVWEWRRADPWKEVWTSRAPGPVRDADWGYLPDRRFAGDGGMVLALAAANRVDMWMLGVWGEIRRPRLLWRRTFVKPPQTVAINNSGERVLVVEGGRARLYAARTGRPVAALDDGVAVGPAAFNWTGSLIATGHPDKVARVWNATTGKLRARLTGHQGHILDVAWYGDDALRPQLLATASTDATVRVWDTQRNALYGTLIGHTNHVQSLEFGLGGRPDEPEPILITTSADQTARVWKAEGNPLAVLIGHSDALHGGSFSIDAALTWSEDGTARTWVIDPDPATDTHYRLPEGPDVEAALVPARGRFRPVLIRRDRVELVLGRGRGRLIARAVHPVVAISADGSLVATAGIDGLAKTRAASSPDRLVQQVRHGGPVTALAIAPDESVLVTAGRAGIARIWQLSDGLKLREVRSGLGTITAAAVSSDGKLVALGDAQGAAGIWDVASGRLRERLVGHRARITSVEFSTDGTSVGTASVDHRARIWNVADGRSRHILGHIAVVSDVSFSPDDRWVVTAGPQRAVLWSAISGKQMVKIVGAGRIFAAGFTPDGRWIRVVSARQAGGYRCAICATGAELRAVAERRLRRIELER
ncbi:MAG: hypothetical protein ICV59_01575 [Thermoleophilia bacterium]|nr:hypothetical protein [Thermoleophilia bacterium]